MKVVFATDVWEEVEDARSFYEYQVDGLGKAFIQTVHDSIQEIKKYPEASRSLQHPYRRFLVPRFPYGIIYRIDQETLYVTAVAHLSKRPFYWKYRRSNSNP